MKKFLFALFLTSSLLSFASLPIADKWSGTLIINPSTKLRIQFNFSETPDGKFEVTLDSPDQGAFGIPGIVNKLTSDAVDVSVPSLKIKFDATVYNTQDGNYLYGNFHQGTLKLPLIMKQESKSMKRPQEPVEPFPYITREVTFSNPDDGATLAGTLTLPENYYEETPVVILVSGSGLQNRDEEIFDHKPFAVIADHFARVGIATLRYDDRGFGASTGSVENATTIDFTNDARAAMNFVRNDLKFKKVGIVGHSEGATIAFILGTQEENAPDFIIGLGTPAAKGETILLDQLTYSLGSKKAKDAFDKAKAEANPWMAYFLEYNPVHDLMKLKVPAMALYGDKDRQVSSKLNVPILEAAAPQVIVKVYKNLNHLMQHCDTGDPSEYYNITETISPEVLLDMVRFIREN